jgi:hypothetical protein
MAEQALVRAIGPTGGRLPKSSNPRIVPALKADWPDPERFACRRRRLFFKMYIHASKEWFNR